MLTLPVPAPMSQRISVGLTASFASAAARTSCFVMGVLPRMKTSFGNPGTRRTGTSHDSTRSTHSGAKALSDIFRTAFLLIFCCGVPRFSPTTACTSPSPASVSFAQITAGVTSPPVKKNVGLPMLHAATGSHAQPCAETRFQFCHGSWMAAESNCTLETPGITVYPMWRSSSTRHSAEAPE